MGQFSHRLVQAQHEFSAFVSDISRLHNSSPLENVSAATVLGSESFVEGVSKKYLEGRRSDPELPALKALESKLSLDHISQAVRLQVDDSKLARKMEVYLMKRFSGAPLKAIGDRYALSSSGISKICSRFEHECEQNRKLKKMVEEVRERLNV